MYWANINSLLILPSSEKSEERNKGLREIDVTGVGAVSGEATSLSNKRLLK